MMKRRALVERISLSCLGLFWVLGVLGACRESDAKGPEIGSRLPSLVSEARLRNAPVGAPAPGNGWLVYFFSPGSSASKDNSARVEALARSLPAGWAFLAVATEEEGLAAFLDRLRVTVPVATQIPRESLAAYQVTAVPRTYVLDRDWKLVEVLDGAYDGEAVDRLQALLKVPVPSPAQETAAPSPQFPPGVCLDGDQAPYSRGAKADVFGQVFQCGAGGLWIPAA